MRKKLISSERITKFLELLRGSWDKELPNLLVVPTERAVALLLARLDSSVDYSLFDYTELQSEKHIRDIKTIRIRSSGPKGSEPTMYYSFKNNGSLRQMGIVNPFLYLAFAYNLQYFESDFFVLHYLNLEHYECSLSPVFVCEGFQVNYDFYGNPDEEYTLSFLVDRYAFNYAKERINDIESSYLYSLHIDIANFYSSVYTHHLERLGDGYNTFNTADDPALKQFFAFLDKYNEKVNLSQTKGLIPGPYSSTVAAELLMCEIDKSIFTRVLAGKNVGYVRNVDDLTFFSDSKEQLEGVFNSVQILLNNYQLPISDSKTRIECCAFEYQEDMLNEVRNIADVLVNEIDRVDSVENFKSSFTAIIKDRNYSAAKGILTSIKTKLCDPERDIHPEQPIRLINLFLKLALTEKWLGSRCMQIIDVLLSKAPAQDRERAIKEIMRKLQIINSSCNDSVIQIWAYYLISVYGSKKDQDDAFDQYVARSEPKNPIVLSTFVKEGDGNNRKLFNAIRQEVGFANGNLFYSRFSPTILRLYVADKNNYSGYLKSLPPIVRDLFGTGSIPKNP